MNFQHFMAGASSASRRFTLYATGGRIYVQDARSFLIDIGQYERADDGFSYRIAGDAGLGDSGFAGADDVLHDLAGRIDRAFLDIRFRTLPDHSEDYSVDFRRAAHCAVDFDRAEDRADAVSASVPAARARQAAAAMR